MAKTATKIEEKAANDAEAFLMSNDDGQKKDGGLDTLRDILFGPQAQATDSRLDGLERALLQTKKELSNSVGEEVGNLRDSSSAQLKTARQELEWQLEKQNNEQTTQLHTHQEEQKIALDRLSADFDEKVQLTQKKLSDKIDELGNRLSEQMMDLQTDSRKRDDDLRQQLLTLSAWLDERKASREDLSDLLIGMGKELQKAKKSKIADNGNEESA